MYRITKTHRQKNASNPLLERNHRMKKVTHNANEGMVVCTGADNCPICKHLAREKALDWMRHSFKWSGWPRLTLKRRPKTTSMPGVFDWELGVLLSTSPGDVSRFTVYLTNVYLNGDVSRFTVYLTNVYLNIDASTPHINYTSYEAILDDGWVVD